MAAAVHGNVGRRATAVDRKVVFKSVLDNPFKISWPNVPLNVQNAALASLVTILSSVGEYHIARQTASRKRKRARHDKTRKEKLYARKKRKVDDGNAGVEAIDAADKPMEVEPPRMDIDKDTCAEVDPDPLPPPPPVFSHLTFGINEVTKRLEAQSQSLRLRTSILSSSTPIPAEESKLTPAPSLLTHVFVCRADIDPPILIAHLPDLVAACNVPSPAKSRPPVRLIPLPKHAEHTLAEAVGLRRVSVLAFDSTTPSLATLSTLLSSVQPPSAPWLTAPTTSHVPTHIKQLRTTAPRDMRAAKRERTEGRQTAKVTRDKIKGKDKQEITNAQGKGKQDGKNAPRKDKVKKAKKRIKITASAPAPSKDHLPT